MEKFSQQWSHPSPVSGDLDLDEAGRLAQWLIQNGNDGLVIAGTTGNRQHLLTMSKLPN
ncbi:MAG: hypothetical protein CM15mP49_27090 [Actinomycetota bacterium]|nr:MAG: hypothetical protein CM15mP49_27090 [Actinomycetota bacterium]